MSLPVTLGDALALAHGRVPASEARLLLREASGERAATIVGFPERPLSDVAAQCFVDWIARREAGEPVAYLLGEREFYGRVFRVSPAVLIPRPDTELLVEQALLHLPDGAPRVLDLGTGSGAIAITIALEAPHAQVSAVDVSAAALSVARENAERLGAQVRWFEGPWCTPVQGEVFDLIASNPPYVAAEDPHLAQGDVRFEPPGALASGPDGLSDIRIITTEAWACLKPGAWLLFEHGYDQGDAVRALMLAAGYTDCVTLKDLGDNDRVTLGRRPV
ncbi:peptide chain release factor N(5)-glutamine methyltransferase [Niveibacterium microcysteis]|uniref:Release factor glutamine methyltransferase n=1 Tax=Niveibacterium microcysteis TaxID=2811415 RepID=A0ABX7M490_9RHOO|nr:peptide chain release factor N(5)-glutamine methyltransferase [Niveibacterium microcysteis]QSI76259.1 peptide chain release factor N(5)-glutamine methyltransferase [Niveibacterium microcysteis]